MRDKMKKTFGVLLASVCVGATLVGCGEGVLNYKGDTLDNYVSKAEVSSNGGFAVEKGDYVYFINGRETEDAANEYGDVVKGSLMRISKADLAAGDYSDIKTVVPSVLAAKDYDAGIYIYGDYVYYATPTTDKMDSGESASSHIDFKKAKLDGSEGPMKDYFLRLSDNASTYRFVEENGTVYCMYEEAGALKSVNTETKDIYTLVESATSEFFFDALDAESPYVYYTMGVTPEDANTQKYNQIYRVSAGATAKVTDEDNAKYAVYDVKGNKVKEYSFDKESMEEANEEAKEADKKAELPHDFEDYTTYPYVNLGELVLDGVGSADYLPQTQYNWEDDRTNCDNKEGYTYTLNKASYQNGKLYLTRTALGSATDSDGGNPTRLYYITDEEVNGEGWNVIAGNKTVTDNVASKSASANTSSALFYMEGSVQYYIYAANSNLYRAGYDRATDTEIEEVCIADGVGSPTLWKIDEANKVLYYYIDSGNGCSLVRLKYNGEANDYSVLTKKEEYQPISLDYLVFNNDWYKPEIIGDVVLYSNAQTYGESTYDYVHATKMGSVAEIKAQNEKYQEVQDKINEYASYSDLQKAMKYYYRMGERVVFDEFKDQYSKSKQETFDEFVALFEEGGEFYGMMEEDFTTRLGGLSERDKISMRDGWRTTVRKDVTTDTDTGTEGEDEEGEKEAGKFPAWAIVLIVAAVGTIAILSIVYGRRAYKAKQAKKVEEMATVNAYKRKKIDTTDDKSIDVYADETEEKAEENTETAEPIAEETTEEATEATVEESAEKDE